MKSFDDPRDQRPQIFHAIANAHHDDGSDADPSQVLLVLEVRIRCEDHAEAGGNCSVEQHAIPKTKPILCMNGGDFESGKLVRELNR